MHSVLVGLALFATTATVAPPHAEIHGTVKDSSGAALPAFVITISSGSLTKNQVADASGSFQFSNLPAGNYRVEAALAGFQSRTFILDLSADATENLSFVTDLSIEYAELTFSCGRGCGDDRPNGAGGSPACSDIEFIESLGANLDNGDRSTLIALSERYKHAVTYSERIAIAEILEQHPLPDHVREDLRDAADLSLRYANIESEGDEWTADFGKSSRQGNLDPSAEWYFGASAVTELCARTDEKLICERGLKSNEEMFRSAVVGLGRRKGTDMLAQIAAGFDRLRDRLSLYDYLELVYFENEEADKIALDRLGEDERKEYLDAVAQYRRSLEEEQLDLE
jgi:hypothetical protein